MFSIQKLVVVTFLIFLQANANAFAESKDFVKGVQGIEFSDHFPSSMRQFLSKSLEELFLVKGHQSTKAHYEIFGGPVHGQVYQRWFLQRVKKIELINDNCNFTAKINPEKELGVIYISSCTDLNPPEEKKFYWLSILFHEARHLEPLKNFWKHQVVLDYSGFPSAMDQSPYGPYGLEKVISSNLAKYCLNCSADFKSQAREVYEDENTWRKLSNASILFLRNDLN